MERMNVGKEEVEADLDNKIYTYRCYVNHLGRSISFHFIVNVIRKLKFKAGNHTIDELANEIIQKDGITLKSNL